MSSRQSWHLFIDIGVNVSNEQVGPNILSLLVLAGLVHSNRFAIHLDHVQDLDRLRKDGNPSEMDAQPSKNIQSASCAIETCWREGGIHSQHRPRS